MNGFIPGLSETLTWPRYGRHNLAIAVMTVLMLALFVASIAMSLAHSGLWWLFPVVLVALYALIGYMIAIMDFLELIDLVS